MGEEEIEREVVRWERGKRERGVVRWERGERERGVVRLSLIHI